MPSPPRPFLVVDKTEDALICFFASSSKYDKRDTDYYHRVVNPLANTKIDSWINLSHIYEVPIVNLENSFYSVAEHDLDTIDHKLTLSDHG